MTKKIINPTKGVFFNPPIYNGLCNNKLSIYIRNAYYIAAKIMNDCYQMGESDKEIDNMQDFFYDVKILKKKNKNN